MSPRRQCWTIQKKCRRDVVQLTRPWGRWSWRGPNVSWPEAASWSEQLELRSVQQGVKSFHTEGNGESNRGSAELSFWQNQQVNVSLRKLLLKKIVVKFLRTTTAAAEERLAARVEKKLKQPRNGLSRGQPHSRSDHCEKKLVSSWLFEAHFHFFRPSLTSLPWLWAARTRPRCWGGQQRPIL